MTAAKREAPETADKLTTYRELEDLVSGFVEAKFRNIVIVGRSGLSKSKTIEKAIGERSCLVADNHYTEFQFFKDLKENESHPVIIDDADDLLKKPLNREMIKSLTDELIFDCMAMMACVNAKIYGRGRRQKSGSFRRVASPSGWRRCTVKVSAVEPFWRLSEKKAGNVRTVAA